MSYYRPRIDTPPDDDDINPYGLVWVPIALQAGILLGIVIAIYLIFRFAAPVLPSLVIIGMSVVIVLLPLVLWLAVGLLQERRALQPRQRLLMVMLVCGLAANAIAVPVIEQVYQVDRWLFLAPPLNRVLGFTFTVGAVQELTKYVVIRYAAWRDHFRTRSDAVAYGIASAVGYVTVLNIALIVSGQPNLDVLAIRVFDNTALAFAGSLIVAFGLAEVRFERPSPFFTPLTVALASFLHGSIMPLRASVTNTGFSARVDVNAPSLILGTLISLGVLAGIGLLISSLFATAQRREREAQAREP